MRVRPCQTVTDTLSLTVTEKACRSVRDRSLLSHVQGLCKQGQTECVPEFVLRRFHRFCLDFALQQQLPHRTCILLQYRAINQ